MPPRPSLAERYADKVLPTDTYSDVMRKTGVSAAHASRIVAAIRAASADPDEAPTEAPVVGEDSEGLVVHSVNEVIRNPEEMLEAAGVDLTKWAVVDSRVSTSATAMRGRKYKDADGAIVEDEPRIVRLWHVRCRLKLREVPLCPLVSWLPPAPFHLDAPDPERARSAVLLPDMQIGYRWVYDTGTPYLRPCHDRAAIDAALQVLARERPTDVVLLGDMLDFAPLSTRWTAEHGSEETTRPALLEWRWLLQRIRSLAPDARIVYLEGNHEARLAKYLDDRAPQLRGLMPTLPMLLDLDALGVEYVPYRDQAWLWGRIRLIHGEVVRQGGGSTAAAVLKGETHSVVYGHVHRCEMAFRRVTGPTGDDTLFAMSPGSLCLPGETPGSTPRSDWQQGVGVIHTAEGLSDAPAVIEIRAGRALHRGEALTGSDYTDELVASSGYGAYSSQGQRRSTQ